MVLINKNKNYLTIHFKICSGEEENHKKKTGKCE